MKSEDYLVVISSLTKESVNLDLSNYNLTLCPQQIETLTWLKKLNLSNNHLCEIPSSISNLVLLEYLYLDNNKLSTLPKSLELLQKLCVLSLTFNQIETFPEPICKLHELRELRLNDNKISILPESIENLKNLTLLYLFNNPLTSIPISINRCQNLKTFLLDRKLLTNLADEVDNLSEGKENQLSQSLNQYLKKQLAPKEGYLQKMGKFVKNWKLRWFTLNETSFQYYQKKGDKNFVASISIRDIISITTSSQVPPKKSIEGGFCIMTPNRTYLLFAESKAEKESWIFAINQRMDYLRNSILTSPLNNNNHPVSRMFSSNDSALLPLRQSLSSRDVCVPLLLNQLKEERTKRKELEIEIERLNLLVKEKDQQVSRCFQLLEGIEQSLNT